MKRLSSLLVAMALSCSKSEIVQPPEESTPKQVSSTQRYSGNIESDFAIYTTGVEQDSIDEDKGCSLELTPTIPSIIGYSAMKLNDYDCDGKVDMVTTIYSRLTNYAIGESAELDKKMRDARVSFDFNYLKFRGNCALIFKNEGEGYLVDEECDDSVDWAVHKIFREKIKDQSLIKEDSFLTFIKRS